LIVTAKFGAGFGPRDWKLKSLSGMDDTGWNFGLLAEHMAWQGQRQNLAAKNITNSDTPGFVPMGHYYHPLVLRRYQNHE